MKKLVLTFALAFTVMGTALAQDTTDRVQENMGTHSVAMGETVLVIAKKYKITPGDIYDYNPDAIRGFLQYCAAHTAAQTAETKGRGSGSGSF
jgi:hypothetical protein